MFSIFDYLRRRTCDAFLAGAYDAIEILQSENANLPAHLEDPADSSKASPPNLPAQGKNGVAQKMLPLATSVSPAQAVTEHKAASPAEKKDEQKPKPVSLKPNSQSPSSTTPPVSSTPQTGLFAADSRRDEPLPPRRRGRPRKNPLDGNAK